jgi:hypothetical protein
MIGKGRVAKENNVMADDQDLMGLLLLMGQIIYCYLGAKKNADKDRPGA